VSTYGSGNYGDGSYGSGGGAGAIQPEGIVSAEAFGVARVAVVVVPDPAAVIAVGVAAADSRTTTVEAGHGLVFAADGEHGPLHVIHVSDTTPG